MEASDILSEDNLGMKNSTGTVNTVRANTPSYIYISNKMNIENSASMNGKPLQLHSGEPLLVLSNNDKGTMEANVLLDSSSSYFKVDFQAIAQANLIAQTQEMLAQQLSQDSLNVERTKKSKKDSKLFKCKSEGCGKVFSSINYLSLHEASHTASKSLICNHKDCGRKFLWPAHLNYHRLTHTNDRQYTCTFDGCNKKFFTGQRLKIHLLTHTGEKPYKCQEKGCSKSFTTAGNLRNHFRIHTGEKPYTCDYDGCYRKFAECSSLKKHKLVHSGEKPFTCELCGKSFSQTGTRSVHMKSHHASPKHHVLQIAEIKLEINGGNNRVVELESPEVLVLQQSTDDITHYHGLTDHIVTITTHQPDNDQNMNDVPHHVLGVEEVLVGGDLNPDQLCNKTANVVVLAQPQEIINLSSTYQEHEASPEEIVYDNDLLTSHLDHEEIHVSNTSLCLEQSSRELTVNLEQPSRELNVNLNRSSEDIPLSGLEQASGDITVGQEQTSGEITVGLEQSSYISVQLKNTSEDKRLPVEQTSGKLVQPSKEVTDGLEQTSGELTVDDVTNPEPMSTEAGKEIAMDPMMESDDETETYLKT